MRYLFIYFIYIFFLTSWYGHFETNMSVPLIRPVCFSD